MTIYDGDESKMIQMKSDSVLGEIIKFAHKEGIVRFRSNTCQAKGCEGHADWIVEYDILGKKNVPVQLCGKHEKAKKSFNIEVEDDA